MNFRAGASLLTLMTVGFLPAAAAARNCGPATVQLAVIDQAGASLSGLGPADFKVHIKGQNANVKALNYGVFPHSTLLLISRSSSMSAKWDLAQQLAQAVVSSAPGTIMTGSYAAEVSNVVDARSGSASVVPAASDSRSVLYDALLADMTNVKLHAGDAVVVITDSPDNGSKTTPAELRQRFSSIGARLFVLALPSADANASMQALSEIANATGGALLAPLGVSDSKIAQAQIDGALTNLNHAYSQYNAVYQLETDADGQDKPLPLRVEIDRRKLNGGKVIAPAMVAPCSAIGE